MSYRVNLKEGMGLLQDLFYAGGILENDWKLRNLYLMTPDGKMSAMVKKDEYRPNYFIEEGFTFQSKAVCDFIINRKFAFNTTDLVLEQITKHGQDKIWYLPNPTENYKLAVKQGSRLYEASFDQLCSYIAAFCAENKIYWDDSKFPKYAASNSYIGSALLHYGCMLSQKGQGF